jgi:hypothetical protein
MSVADNVANNRRVRARLVEELPFLAVAIQFGLIVLLVLGFHLESLTFGRLMVASLVGFLVHHYLPVRFRLPFFACLSLIGTLLVAHVQMGLVLVSLGLVLILLCHLPMSFWGRAALVGVAGLGLAIARYHATAFPALEGMWPILGSMFIFRILLYLYALKYDAAPFSAAHAVSYFFMLPNVCFPLFPVVDYKTYCSSHYNDNAISIYQLGLKWMLRGIVQLLLYRLIYSSATLNLEDVTNARKVAEYMVATYLLYLHVSGQFHLIVGLLHMFGFNLPETHHLYLLSSSFTDFWRRINIYWKDFILKLFFYPAFFAFKRIGALKAIALATVLAFASTWALHTWQWYWFRGHFLLSSQDIVFWTILALLVVVNAVYEAVAGRKRTLSKPAFSFKARLRIALKTIGTFVVICSLWTLWSCQSWGELQVLAEAATFASWADILVILSGLALLGVAGALWGGSSPETSSTMSAAIVGSSFSQFWRSAAVTGIGALLILALVPARSFFEADSIRQLVTTLREDQLNSHDVDLQRRGYYEELDVVRTNYRLWGSAIEAPDGWTSDELFQIRDDFLQRSMKPNATGKLAGAIAVTNRWGMRDRDYELQKPDNTYRILLLGSSHEAGNGVANDETFENVVERRLNVVSKLRGNTKVEILNLSVGGYGVLRNLALLEQRGFDFAPDAVILCVNARVRHLDLRDLSICLNRGLTIPHDFLDEVFEEAGVAPGQVEMLVTYKLKPHFQEIYRRAFKRLLEQCSQRRTKVWVLYRPGPIEGPDLEADRHSQFLQIAREVNLDVIDLFTSFDHVADRKSLIVAPWDDHTNALGHRLLAQSIYPELAREILHERDQASVRHPVTEVTTTVDPSVNIP